MIALNLTKDEAERKLKQTDRARREYLRHFYRRDWADPSLYHVMLDSTALPLSTCTQLVLEAAYGRRIASRPEPT